jgi:hypothetical protein
MVRTLATRLAVLEVRRQARLRQWWESLSDDEQKAEVDRRFGVGTWEWLDKEVEGLTLEQIETTDILWQRYQQWRKTRP